jgi:hypothetical protein
LIDSLVASRLVIQADSGKYFLAWEVRIPEIQFDGQWIYLIDATNGNVLTKHSTIINDIASVRTTQPQANIYLQHPGINSATTLINPLNVNLSGYIQGTYANILNYATSRAYAYNSDFAYSITDTHFDEANLYYHIDNFRRNYIDGLGFSAFTQITATAHFPFSSPNANYNQVDHQLRFSDGQGWSGYNSFAREDKVIMHEYTHAVTDYIAHLVIGTSGETASIHEGNSDYFAGSFTGRPLILEYSLAGFQTDWRNLTSPYIATYSQGNPWPTVECHYGGEFWSSALWNLRTNIGQYYADNVIYKGLSGIPTNSSFLQYRQAIMNADMIYFGGTHMGQIAHTFYLKGIGPDQFVFTTISGPGNLDFKETGTYTALANGGSENRSYQWYVSDNGGSSWTILGTTSTQSRMMSYSDFILRCDVHDNGTGESASVQKVIYYGIEQFSLRAGKKLMHIGQEIPNAYSIEQNYPNPFNPSTVIAFAIPSDGNVSVKVYDMVGREVASLVSGYCTAGRYEIAFDGTRLPSGIYIYRIQSGAFSAVKKMQLVK